MIPCLDRNAARGYSQGLPPEFSTLRIQEESYGGRHWQSRRTDLGVSARAWHRVAPAAAQGDPPVGTPARDGAGVAGPRRPTRLRAGTPGDYAPIAGRAARMKGRSQARKTPRVTFHVLCSCPILVLPREWQPRRGAWRHFPSGTARSSRPFCVQGNVTQPPNSPVSPKKDTSHFSTEWVAKFRGNTQPRRGRRSAAPVAYHGTRARERGATHRRRGGDLVRSPPLHASTPVLRTASL